MLITTSFRVTKGNLRVGAAVRKVRTLDEEDKLFTKFRPIAKRGGAWTQAEDAMLQSAVAEFGPKRWCRVSARVPGRTEKQCRQRWHYHIEPKTCPARTTRNLTFDFTEFGFDDCNLGKELLALVDENDTREHDPLCLSMEQECNDVKAKKGLYESLRFRGGSDSEDEDDESFMSMIAGFELDDNKPPKSSNLRIKTVKCVQKLPHGIRRVISTHSLFDMLSAP